MVLVKQQIHFMLTLIKAQKGKILIDNQDLQEKLIEYRDIISYVPQDIVIMTTQLKIISFSEKKF